ncbi:hypothetical protein TanjilG_14798 [Lupinus angustifolius]|uniref:Uncharacterized protein n=1 Tax=Lupinus angustifolius TaxID=3871 RepID=A0A1J7FR95_LUPAN|nr:PREDICTED: uncharacterized protein LOC109335715 [Lupinus angustifolius]XP_019427411.1 PREDICTED: uncharacterized protein LOC109335716 [Lupinus angustifolius]XP_019427412.1 PREDICTED: uncharacterized protein LOC109335718 [Lupinus angustifolius]XP_019427413.1 PREDICTED: uncharacterized protein LOC109335719 [Lupinus angustifolius]XP_019463203.1 PREDICTED: uncharacterized protein LOC109362089 [Lupinus angustifolius]XP_019463205.1 PREDICTED: uncharacterized protein LOC109362091 [Lupinus angustif
MVVTIKSISIFLFFLGLIFQGYCKPCSLGDLSVKKSKTGVKIQGKPEWLVTVTNNCHCGQSQVILNCRGYKTVEPVDPNILTYSGTDYCLINYGKPIYKQPVTFKYAWDEAFSMSPNSSQMAC